ncbi:hypothetical protein F5B21DRAFT_493787 [Xylaria acuta]|nr:hypothetical protein F5B21DRAFT_493787 [Xylaria acuta]
MEWKVVDWNLTALCPVPEPVVLLVSQGVIDVRLYERVLGKHQKRTGHDGSHDMEDEDEGEGDHDGHDDENDDNNGQLFWAMLQSSTEEDPFSVMQGLSTIGRSVARELAEHWIFNRHGGLPHQRDGRAAHPQAITTPPSPSAPSILSSMSNAMTSTTTPSTGLLMRRVAAVYGTDEGVAQLQAISPEIRAAYELVAQHYLDTRR